VNSSLCVEVTRGGRVESRHLGSAVVVDASGVRVVVFGDPDMLVYPRSAVKIIQALVLIECGAADAFGWGNADLALACGSHSGGPEHTERVAAQLARLGLDEAALVCGAHWPLGVEEARALAGRGASPSRLHNNCSGKHAGFLCAASSQGIDLQGYNQPEHPVQRQVMGAIEALCSHRLAPEEGAGDGCGVPTFATPLSKLALGMARMATGDGLPSERAVAAKRLMSAAARHPEMVAGEGRFDTRVMRRMGARVFTKTGAEGVYCAAIPELGYGVALKAHDGATRASEAMMGAVLARLMPFGETDRDALAEIALPKILDWNGCPVGDVRVRLSS
jgi:L-asparaginase II